MIKVLEVVYAGRSDVNSIVEVAFDGEHQGQALGYVDLLRAMSLDGYVYPHPAKPDVLIVINPSGGPAFRALIDYLNDTDAPDFEWSGDVAFGMDLPAGDSGNKFLICHLREEGGISAGHVLVALAAGGWKATAVDNRRLIINVTDLAEWEVAQIRRVISKTVNTPK